MKRMFFRLIALYVVLLPMVVLLSSCSGKDYVNVIPKDSKALVAVDVQGLMSLSGKADKYAILNLLKVDDVNDCGIDISSKVYLFETAEGNIGLSANVVDEDEVNGWLDKLAKDGLCQPLPKYKDYRFAVIKDSWVVGVSSGAVVILGPALPTQHVEISRQIAKYFEQDENEGINGTKMFTRIDSVDSPLAVVARADALPENFVAPLTIGTSKDVDNSQVFVAASLESVSDGCIVVNGETFSFNKNVDNELKKARDVFRPIGGKYLDCMSKQSALGAFLNVDGKRFIELLHSNKTFMALLAGMNMAIDMDNIIKSVDGDMAVVLKNSVGDNPAFLLGAQLGSKAFLEDVDYWKQSCPAGTRIVDSGKNAYRYSGNGFSMHFGVSDDMQFYAGSTEKDARTLLEHSADALNPTFLKSVIKGKRFAMIINIDAMFGNNNGFYTRMIPGRASTIIYIMK